MVSKFDKVIIVPAILEGAKEEIDSKIEIEESYAKFQDSLSIFNKILLVLTSKLFYNEITLKPKVLFYPRMLLKLMGFVGKASMTQKWLSKYIQNQNLDLTKTVFYTYWFDSITLGISLVKKDFQNLKIISRAHGYDLYEERYNPPYIPCRFESLKRLNRLFLISENGKNYITKKYSDFTSLFQVSKLGVKEPDFSSTFSNDGIFRVVSCSFIVPIKRLDLLLKGIAELARFNTKQKFEWYHIGDGPLRHQIEDLAKKNLPKNVNYYFLGYLPNDKVMLFYKENPVDVFINVSSSEGISVSIMEAQSCGIPVIATAVGGTPDIVSEEVGKLLSQNPTANEIANAISTFFRNPEIAQEKRNASKENWREKYNADKNFTIFADELFKLIN